MRPIDADALCDAMYHEAFENDDSYDERNPMARWDSGLWIRYKMFENAIDDAPTIEPKRGEWIRDMSSPIAYKCTACNTLQHWSVIQDGRYHFCPNCGADMREREGE